MQSPYNFIVSPIGGKYVTTKKIGSKTIYTTASIEEAKYVNRTAIVVSIPLNYTGKIKSGDTIIIHHNIFRDYYNMKGDISKSPNHIFDDLFLLSRDLIYLYKSDNGWEANDNYCFIRPYKEVDELTGINKEVELKGIVVYSNYFDKGSKIGFVPESEYQFEIDDEILYRMRASNICLIE